MVNFPMIYDVELFIYVCNKPGMYVQGKRYEDVCAFIDGYDMALRGGTLKGFAELLLSEGSEHLNHSWWAILRRQLFPDKPFESPLSESESEEAILALASALKRYLDCVKEGGLELIYQKYFKWRMSHRDEVTRAECKRLRLDELRGHND